MFSARVLQDLLQLRHNLLWGYVGLCGLVGLVGLERC